MNTSSDKIKYTISGILIILCLLFIGSVTYPFAFEQFWSIVKILSAATAAITIFNCGDWEDKKSSLVNTGKLIFFIGVTYNATRYFIITQFEHFPVDYWGDLSYHLLVIMLSWAAIYEQTKRRKQISN